MKTRAILAIALGALFIAGCEAILGLHDRTLEGGDAASEASVDATTCDGDFCACNPHAFCDDFDPYTSVQDLQKHWPTPNGFQSSLFQIGGSLALDNGTNVLPPTSPNALLASVVLPTPLQGAGFVLGQIDAQAPNITGIHVAVRFRVVALDPADGAPPILDSGVALFGAVLAVIDSATKNGVGVAMSDQGAYVGYALDVLSAGARLTQGKQFLSVNPVTLSQLGQYVQLDTIIAKRSSKQIPPVDCTPGPVLTDIDGGAPDAAPPTDPVVVVVSTSITPPSCEVLSADLALANWLGSPAFMIGSVVKGQGVFSVDFDNFTLDFTTD